MGNDVMSWRVAIGIFNCKLGCVVKSFKYASKPFSFIIESLLFLFFKIKLELCHVNSYMQSSILNLEFALVIFLLVLMSGDVEINPGPSTTDGTRSISVLHLNIRSLRNKIEFIKDHFIEYDILCFTETHLSDTVTDDLLFIEGFSIFYRKDRTNHASGIMIYISDNVISRRLEELETPNLDTIWVEIKDKNECFLLCTVYRQPSLPIAFWDSLNISLDKAFDISDKVILLGDINEDQLSDTSHYLKDIMLINNMKNVIREPTRVTDTSAKLLDPIVISSSIEVLDSEVIETPQDVTDHFATVINIKFSYDTQHSYYRRVWNYKKADFHQLNNLIANTDWSFLYIDCVDIACKGFS